MDILFKYVLPIGAFTISLLSIGISMWNLRFSRRYEAAKKKTELLTTILGAMAKLAEAKDRMRNIEGKCRDCVDENGRKLDEAMSSLYSKVENLYEEICNATTVTDPVKIQEAIGMVERVRHRCDIVTKEVNSISERIAFCQEKNSKTV